MSFLETAQMAVHLTHYFQAQHSVYDQVSAITVSVFMFCMSNHLLSCPYTGHDAMSGEGGVRPLICEWPNNR